MAATASKGLDLDSKDIEERFWCILDDLETRIRRSAFFDWTLVVDAILVCVATGQHELALEWLKRLERLCNYAKVLDDHAFYIPAQKSHRALLAVGSGLDLASTIYVLGELRCALKVSSGRVRDLSPERRADLLARLSECLPKPIAY